MRALYPSFSWRESSVGFSSNFPIGFPEGEQMFFWPSVLTSTSLRSQIVRKKEITSNQCPGHKAITISKTAVFVWFMDSAPHDLAVETDLLTNCRVKFTEDALWQIG
jgi:hypothetical protein